MLPTDPFRYATSCQAGQQWQGVVDCDAWTPERIDVFVDDELYFTYVNEGKGWREWPYDQPFHLVLNLAIGGAWGRAGGDIDDSRFPQRMLIDYVRVYQTRD